MEMWVDKITASETRERRKVNIYFATTVLLVYLIKRGTVVKMFCISVVNI